MSPVIDAEAVAQILKQCAADYVLPRYNALQEEEINTKSGPNDLVTRADLDVEEHLVRVLPDFLPGSAVIGEEGVAQGTASLDILRNTDNKIWIVDPVDGTYNFVHGRPGFGIMLSCVIGGEIQYGWIYEIIGDNMLIAEKGSGACLNGKRTQVAHETDLAKMKGHMSLKFFPPALRRHLKDKMRLFSPADPVCCASDYLNIAAGKTHFSLYTRLNPWDHFAGVLITSEAGAYSAKWDGSPFCVQGAGPGLITATSKELWHEIRRVFLEDWIKKGRLTD